ncbi:MAG: hypothetical protein ACE5NP_06740 [Anaerolineae bacterium]
MKRGTGLRPHYRHHLYVVLAYLALTLLMTYPLLFNLGTAIPGDGFDGWQNYWNLWWGKRALLDLRVNPYFTNYLYHPSGASLLFHTLNIFNTFLTMPVQLDFGLMVAYNFVVLFSFVVSGYGVYLLACYLLTHAQATTQARHPYLRLAAFICGLIFAFSPFRFAHLLGHMQVFSSEWVPFYALFFIKGLDRMAQGRSSASGFRDLASTAWKPTFFLILATLCDWYQTLYLALFSVLYLLHRVWQSRQFWRPVAQVALIGVLFTLAFSPLLWTMLGEARVNQEVGRPYEETVTLSADLLAFLTPNELHPLWGEPVRGWADRFTSTTAERTVFSGYLPMLLALFGAVKGKKRARFWLASLLLFFILALGPVLHVGGRTTFTQLGITIPLPYLLLYRLVPFMKIARSVSRFDMMVMLSLAILAGYGISYVMLKGRGWLLRSNLARTGILAGCLGALILFEFLSIPYPLSPPEIHPFYRDLSRQPGEFAILELPMNWDRPAQLLYQTVHGKRLISAYTSRANLLSIVERTPVLQQFRYLGPDITVQDLAEIRDSVLWDLDVRYVILHKHMLPPGQERDLNFALVQEVFAGQEPTINDDWLVVYQIVQPAVPRPYLLLGDGWESRQVMDDQVRRRMKEEAVVHAVVPQAQEVRLAFVVESSPGPQSLRVSYRDQVIGTFQITLLSREFVTDLVELGPGRNAFRFTRQAPLVSEITFLSLRMLTEG